MEEEKKKAGRPFGTKKVDPATATEQKATFIVSKVLLNKIKLLVQAESYRRTVAKKEPVTVKLKDVVDEALGNYVAKYEQENGEL
ncbi:MAG: hypothetical protein JWQ25_1961 [Daejeonella sp.]|nr:hypothetical protein [Daejeonella sp.]